jgi:hypothetical protein
MRMLGVGRGKYSITLLGKVTCQVEIHVILL